MKSKTCSFSFFPLAKISKPTGFVESISTLFSGEQTIALLVNLYARQLIEVCAGFLKRSTDSSTTLWLQVPSGDCFNTENSRTSELDYFQISELVDFEWVSCSTWGGEGLWLHSLIVEKTKNNVHVTLELMQATIQRTVLLVVCHGLKVRQSV